MKSFYEAVDMLDDSLPFFLLYQTKNKERIHGTPMFQSHRKVIHAILVVNIYSSISSVAMVCMLLSISGRGK